MDICAAFPISRLLAWLVLNNLHPLVHSEQAPDYCPGPEALLSPAEVRCAPLSSHTEAAEPPEVDSKTRSSAAEPFRCFANATLIPTVQPLLGIICTNYPSSSCLSRGTKSPSHDNEVHPTSIVINVTTNIKPSSQSEEEQQSCREATEEVQQTTGDIMFSASI